MITGPKTMDDYPATPRTTKSIEAITLAWRDTFRVADQWAPDIVRLVESEMPKIIPAFALVVRADAEMGENEAYTEFNPPHIAVRTSVYHLARRRDGRSRMTFAHELGHLVMHPDGIKFRNEAAIKRTTRIRYFESAEWQAKKFASLFLMPEHIVRQFGTAHELSENCQVSLQAAEIRFRQVGHIPPPTVPESIQEAIDSFR
jgi:Zn-dependent peptidase ImmA (M78 family)